MAEIIEVTKVDARTGKCIEEGEYIVRDGETGIMIVKCDVYADTFKNIQMLGRFIIRDRKEMVGYGIVKELLYE